MKSGWGIRKEKTGGKRSTHVLDQMSKSAALPTASVSLHHTTTTSVPIWKIANEECLVEKEKYGIACRNEWSKDESKNMKKSSR